MKIIQKIRVYGELTKPRVTLLVVFSAMVGFELGRRGPWQSGLFLAALAGTWMLAGGASALNQWMEAEEDGRMRRTCRRPLPSGRLSRRQALVFGLLISAAGLALLYWGANPLACWLGLVTWASYLLAYTPLKKVTSLSTVVGAVPGALPPVMGWAAASGTADAGAWILFGILFLWQVPHFLSIACLYAEDYKRGGFKMMPGLDDGGKTSGRQMVLYALALIPASLLPSLLGLTGEAYFYGAVLLGAGYAVFSLLAAANTGSAQARRVLLASVTYLPFLQALMLFDKVR